MKILISQLIRRFCFSHILIFALTLLFFDQTARAITDSYPLKPPDTSSPRATMKVFKDYINRAYQKSLVKGYKDEAVINLLNRAAECLDLSEIARNVVQNVGIEKALLLKEVFERIELPPYKEIPNKETAGFDSLARSTVPNTAIEIVKVEKRPREGEFLFSTGTVARMREFYDRVKSRCGER